MSFKNTPAQLDSPLFGFHAPTGRNLTIFYATLKHSPVRE